MSTDSVPASPRQLPVRALVEFVLQSGDLTAGGFQRRDRAQLGTQGHRQVQRSRPATYQAEVELSCRVEGVTPPLEVRGRMDGLYPDRHPPVVEEIKTTGLELAQLGEDHNPLHWAQARCYAYLYARQHGLERMEIHLTYVHLDSQEQKTFQRRYGFTELEQFFNDLLATYLAWFGRVDARREQRDRTIQQMAFPYADYRPGQREMAVAVYQAIREKKHLYLQAPTGVGKTIAALFPAVKALGQGLAQKIFYLTARTPGRAVAEKALADLRDSGMAVSSVTLTAREKICFCPPVDCNPERCPFARGYYDRLKTALAELDLQQDFTRVRIEALARRYELCPFELSLDLALWVDVILCDYNYVFDPRVYLHRFFDLDPQDYLFLVDEAHNLPDRAREMYSAALDKQTVLALQRTLNEPLSGLARRLGAINRLLLEMRKDCQAQERQFLVQPDLPEALLHEVRGFYQKAEDWLALNQPAEFRQDLLEFYFSCLNFMRTAEEFGPSHVCYVERLGGSDMRVKLFCLDPAPLLATRLARSRATLFFSATLLPIDYFMTLLTGEESHPWRIFASPFPPENACLLIDTRISTRYTRRADSYATIAESIAAVCAARPGNYLVYFPSYAYLESVLALLPDQLPDAQLLVQERAMSESDREAFLECFSSGGTGTLVGLAVMGGIFGEGIDLVGERLIGVVVVGVGVPQIGLERDLIREYFDRHQQNGFAYAYQYPGFNRVLQAIGRVIRSETDRGVLVLIDDRFGQARYRQLFPTHWQNAQFVRSLKQLQERLAGFWENE